jgi:mRNA-degrading endonuclease RelE of RelBE toxin-antitoxin system
LTKKLPFKFNITNSFYKDYNKLPTEVQKIALKQGKNITANPQIGTKYSGNWGEFWKLEFGNNPQYRIIYKVYFCKKQKQNGKFYCVNKIIHHKIQLQSCEGLIDYVLLKTREFMNNYYKLKKNNINIYIRYSD